MGATYNNIVRIEQVLIKIVRQSLKGMQPPHADKEVKTAVGHLKADSRQRLPPAASRDQGVKPIVVSRYSILFHRI